MILLPLLHEILQIVKGLVPDLLHFFEFKIKLNVRLRVQPLRLINEVLHHSDFNLVRDDVAIEAPLAELISLLDSTFD